MKALPLVALALLAGCVGADAPAPPSLTEASAEASEAWTAGTATFTFTGACPQVAPAHCTGFMKRDGGELTLPEGAAGVVVEARWEPASPLVRALHVHVSGKDGIVAVARGASPLRLEVGALPAGDYRVAATPGDPFAGQLTQEIAWTMTWRPTSAPPDG